MKQRQSPLDWHFSDEPEWDEQQWQRHDAAAGLDNGDGQGWLQHWWWITAALGALLVVLLALYRTPATEPTSHEPTTSESAPPLRRIETAFFHIYYRQQDAEVVADVATDLDQIYSKLRSDFGLAPPSPQDQVWVLVPAPLNTSEPGSVPIFAPATALSPTAMSEPASVLARYLANELALRILAEAQRQHAIRPGWQTMLAGLHYYFWANQHGEQVLPDALALAVRWHPNPPLPVYRITGASPPHALPVADPLDTILAAGLVDYLVQTYGRDRLGALLDGLSRYYSWTLLSRTVFGVEATELETGWHAWLEAQR